MKVLVYSMGKVGSTAVTNALNSVMSKNVHNVHRLNPSHIKELRNDFQERGLPLPSVHERGLNLFRNYVQKGKKIKAVSLCREPVIRNVSAFFYNYDQLLKGTPSEKSIKTLKKEFLKTYDHEVPVDWFQKEPEEIFDMNILESSFLKEEGYEVYRSDLCEMLVMKTELSDDDKANLLQDFFDLDKLPDISRRNEGTSKPYSEVYKEFKRSVVLPKDYLDYLLDSDYTCCFYTQNEISEVRSDWI